MTAMSVAKGVARGVAQSVVDVSGAFSPVSLFASGAQGGWYDPSDITTLFQDAAGTVPVTASGQPVGRILDKSGRGNHLTQSVAISRPTYTVSGGLSFLAFDGVDDHLVSGNINLTAAIGVFLFTGLRKASDVAVGCVAELSVDTALNDGTFIFAAPGTVATGDYLYASRGTLQSIVNSPASYAAPITNVLTCSSAIAADLCSIRVDNGTATTSAADQGTGGFGNFPLYVGMRAGLTLPFVGNIYGLILLGRNVTAAESTNTARYLGQKSGIVIP